MLSIFTVSIPDFIVSQIASDATESLKRHIKRHVSQVSADPASQRQMYAAANSVLDELESEIKEVIQEKLASFLRKV